MGLLGWLIAIGLFVMPLWVAMKKAGMNPAISLLSFIPVVGISIALFIFAYGDWPAMEKKVANGA